MRVTNNMLITGLLHNVNANLSKMSEYQDELATGKKIQTPSDDPIGISKVLKYKTDLSELEQYGTNTRDALSWLETTEIALIDINNALQRVRELTVQAASGSNAPGDVDKIKSEIEQLKNHIISAANTSYAGRYIFSSYHTDEKLMNEDGTFNIDITNYEIENKPITKYEIGIGDVMDISTNGIDLFGVVETENLLNTALPDSSNVQLKGDVNLSGSYSVTDAQHMGDFDLNADHTAEDLDITIIANGVSMTFAVDESILDGSSTALTEQDVVDAFSNATTEDGELLSDYAEIKFDAGDFLITPFAQGETVEIRGGRDVFAHQSITADIDPEIDYLNDHDFDITIDVGGVPTTYDVDQTAFDGTLDEAAVIALFEDALDPGLNRLGDNATIYFNESGELVITPNTLTRDTNISVADSDAFDVSANVGTGDAKDSWNIRVGGIVYDVDESLLDGSVTPLTEDEFVEALRAATAYSPYTGTLEDAADIYFDKGGMLIIKAKTTGADVEISGPENYFVKETLVNDTKQQTVGAQKAKMMGYFDNDTDYSIKKATMIGEFELRGDYTADDLTITMDVSGTTYTFNVDESALNGSFTELTESEVLEVFKNAADGGNLLSDFAEVEFDEDGYLIIDARRHGEDVTIDGGATVFSQRSLVSSFNTATDYTGSDFNVTLTINGSPAVYDVDESLLNGTLSDDEIIEVFENTSSPTAGLLKSVADIYFDSTGQLVISAKSQRPNIHISSADPGIFGTATNVGKGLEANNLDITIDGITYDIDESLLDGSVISLEDGDIAELFKSAKAYQPDTGTLSDVADVFFDQNGNLIVQTKEFGDDVEITGAASVFNTTSLIGSVTLTNDYSAETLDITIDGNVYDVDESLFDGSGTPLTEDEIIKNLGYAKFGTTNLSEVADIYFTAANELVITIKDQEPGNDISYDASNTIFNANQPTNIGRETQEIEMPAGGYINDEMVEEAVDEQIFVITIDGETKTLTVDMESYDTVNELVNGLQDAIDEAFPPTADVVVSTMGEDGMEALVFSTVNSPSDGTVREFDIRAVRSSKSQMIQDFDDLIAALDEDNILARQAAEQAVEDAEEAEEEARVAAESGEPADIAALEAAEQATADAQEALDALLEEVTEDISSFITKFQGHLDNLNTIRSDIGGKTNRMELVLNRIDDDNINYTQLLSNAEDADMSEIIMKLKNAENVYQASLSTGARVIQPSLVDFIK